MAQNGDESRTFDVLPDPADFRDRLYEPTLIEVPPRIDLEAYKLAKVPILNQGSEGACTGFALSTVANYLLRRRKIDPDDNPVSPRMLYEMAKRYDEWPGERYEGSSARGAMKGWHKHGVCSNEIWPYKPKKIDRILTSERIEDAVRRPLGAYYRVNHKDLVSMHSAINEVGILYVTAVVHDGWYHPTAEGVIEPNEKKLGGHAFTIVAYNEDGFWVQNSWGDRWAKDGFGLLTYDDWLENAMDVWVARLGAPIRLRSARATATSLSDNAGKAQVYTFSNVRPHIVCIGNDGRLNREGTFGNTEEDVAQIFSNDFPRITKGWTKRRILLYAHGGLVNDRNAVQRIADYRPLLLQNEIYPIAFIWKTDFWTTLTNILEDALRRRRPEGPLDAAKNFLLDRLDDAIEPLARTLGGKYQWDEIKENGILATKNAEGGSRVLLKYLDELLVSNSDIEIHLAAHSAGSIFLAPLAQLLATSGKVATGPMKGKPGYGRVISSCHFWAPAVTIELFKETYLPIIKNDGLKQFDLYTLTDKAEQDDHCANIYHKSILYLVSYAFEEVMRIPLIRDIGEPILGMAKYVANDAALTDLFKHSKVNWYQSPNNIPEGEVGASRCLGHGDFDDDRSTLISTVTRILRKEPPNPELEFQRSADSMKDERAQLNSLTKL
ncbi:MAG TPA: C1 family peptidase [Anaerolineae bacterium]|nr:C1 family peptidase [Anaerolineae bacterium]MCB0222930.1 C1 family peptidase [Anaerolineae bacterium]HRV91115.1 C1 family peptidase [Anaerolineae bacterium]